MSYQGLSNPCKTLRAGANLSFSCVRSANAACLPERLEVRAQQPPQLPVFHRMLLSGVSGSHSRAQHERAAPPPQTISLKIKARMIYRETPKKTREFCSSRRRSAAARLKARMRMAQTMPKKPKSCAMLNITRTNCDVCQRSVNKVTTGEQPQQVGRAKRRWHSP